MNKRIKKIVLLALIVANSISQSTKCMSYLPASWQTQGQQLWQQYMPSQQTAYSYLNYLDPRQYSASALAAAALAGSALGGGVWYRNYLRNVEESKRLEKLKRLEEEEKYIDDIKRGKQALEDVDGENLWHKYNTLLFRIKKALDDKKVVSPFLKTSVENAQNLMIKKLLQLEDENIKEEYLSKLSLYDLVIEFDKYEKQINQKLMFTKITSEEAKEKKDQVEALIRQIENDNAMSNELKQDFITGLEKTITTLSKNLSPNKLDEELAAIQKEIRKLREEHMIQRYSKLEKEKQTPQELSEKELRALFAKQRPQKIKPPNRPSRDALQPAPSLTPDIRPHKRKPRQLVGLEDKSTKPSPPRDEVKITKKSIASGISIAASSLEAEIEKLNSELNEVGFDFALQEQIEEKEKLLTSLLFYQDDNNLEETISEWLQKIDLYKAIQQSNTPLIAQILLNTTLKEFKPILPESTLSNLLIFTRNNRTNSQLKLELDKKLSKLRGTTNEGFEYSLSNKDIKEIELYITKPLQSGISLIIKNIYEQAQLLQNIPGFGELYTALEQYQLSEPATWYNSAITAEIYLKKISNVLKK